MVQALINIHKDSNRVLNMIKAKYDLRTKSEAIDQMVAEYLDSLPEPPLRPEYVKKALRIHRQKGIPFGTVENLQRMIELNVIPVSSSRRSRKKWRNSLANTRNTAAASTTKCEKFSRTHNTTKISVPLSSI